MASRTSNDGSWGRRKSLFALTTLRSSSDSPDSASGRSQRSLIKKFSRPQTPSSIPETTNTPPNSDAPDDHHAPGATEAASARTSSAAPHSIAHRSDSSRSHLRRPSLSIRASSRRAPSVLDSFRSNNSIPNARSNSDEYFGDTAGEPLSATLSKASSTTFDSAVDGTLSSRNVLLHGEVQTSAGMFRKKKEYLVLTEVTIIRYKSQAKAADTFKTIPHPIGRSPTVRHGSMPSVGSQSDLQTMSDSSGDKDGRVLLRQIVATHKIDDGKPYFALEVCYLDEESSQASTMTLQFNNPDERDLWLNRIRRAANDVRLSEPSYISPLNLENAARIVERDNDYEPSNCAIFKCIQRLSPKSGSRASSDDISKLASVVCFLAIGVHKVHLIQLSKMAARSSSPSLTSGNTLGSYGVLTICGVKVSSVDDTFEVMFRQPLQKQRVLYLASSASHEIAARLYAAENFLRPECGHRLFRMSAPAEVEDLLPPSAPADVEEHNCVERTLTAYCVAYGVNPANIRYTVVEDCEDAPRFELHSPADARRHHYGPLELLAILRALRYNESFGSLSFAGMQLDALNGLHDSFGQELVCSRTKRGTPIRLTPHELRRSSLLVQEVRALAATSKRLRRMDFSGCVTSTTQKAVMSADASDAGTRDIGCGIVEALFPLCKHQTTNVDWVCLNGIELSDTDLDYLVGAAVDKSCHFRAIELNRCGLNDRSMGLILDALRAQENTLESLEVAGNTARLNPLSFDSQLGIFGFIRKLNLSYVSRTSGTESLLQTDTLMTWRLQELRLSGTVLNSATIDAVAAYLGHPQSDSLHHLFIDNAFLSGSDVAMLLRSLSWDQDQVRDMHLDISQNLITKGLEQVTQAISEGATPTQLSMRAIEYREEASFRKILNALTVNKKIRFLDMSQTALPGDASDETCKALERFLAENDTIIQLDLSGDDSRLAASKFGSGINDALAGLRQNQTIQVLRLEKQKLGFPGASALAEVLRENRVLLELHCDNNEIPLHGLTDLVNSLIENTTLVYLPTMHDGRNAAFRAAEATMKVMSDMESPTSPASNPSRSLPFTSSSAAVRKGIASVRRSAQRGAANYTPSFPALPSYNRVSPPPDQSQRHTSPLAISLPATKHHHRPSTSQSSIHPAPTTFTVQDIQTTHRLLSEQWDRQCYRLSQYLERNWCLLHDIPCAMEVEDEKFERPASVGSIAKMLEQVKSDTTPKAERPAYFDNVPPPPPPHHQPATLAAKDPSIISSSSSTTLSPAQSSTPSSSAPSLHLCLHPPPPHSTSSSFTSTSASTLLAPPTLIAPSSDHQTLRTALPHPPASTSIPTAAAHDPSAPTSTAAPTQADLYSTFSSSSSSSSPLWGTFALDPLQEPSNSAPQDGFAASKIGS